MAGDDEGGAKRAGEAGGRSAWRPRARAEALALALGASLLVACLVVGALVTRPLGVPLPPFAMRPDASIGVGAGVAVLVLVAAVGVLARLTRRVEWHPALAAALLALVALAVRLAVNAARSDGTHGWTRAFDLDSREGPLEYVAGRDALVYGRRFLLDRFAELVPSLPVHVAGHPPGLVLGADLVGATGAADLAAWCIAASALIAPLTYALARTLIEAPRDERPEGTGANSAPPGGAGLQRPALEREQRARAAGALAALAPGAVLIGATSADALYATVGVAAATLLAAGNRLRDRGSRIDARALARRLAGAVLLGVGSFASWALLAVGAFVVVRVPLRDGPRAAAALALTCAAGVLAVHGALAAAWGWDPIGTIRATEDVYRHGIAQLRPWWYWAAGSPAAWAAFGGVAVAAPWLVAVARREPTALALLAIVATAALLGFSKAETERIWLFMLPLACVAAATVVPPSRLVPLLALCAAQALAVQLLFDTVW